MRVRMIQRPTVNNNQHGVYNVMDDENVVGVIEQCRGSFRMTDMRPSPRRQGQIIGYATDYDTAAEVLIHHLSK